MRELGKVLLGFGALLVILGGIFLVAPTFTGKVSWLGRLPGDIHIERDGWTLSVPLATCILISIVLTLVFSLFGRR